MVESWDAAAYAKQTPETGTPIAGDNPVYLPDPVTDATVRMLVELAAQVWIDRERLLVLETLLAEHGVVTRAAVESFKPSVQQAQEFKAQRNQFIEEVFKSLRTIPVG
ncbi:MAG: hypothetical protein KDI32_12070 [Pseudomonadales bacterium]|nr:hypothetical protein [Pseudomonadales bacterium]